MLRNSGLISSVLGSINPYSAISAAPCVVFARFILLKSSALDTR